MSVSTRTGSSQLGFRLGLARAGWPVAIAAFIPFTLPSAVLLVVLSQLLPYLANDISQAAIHGLKIVALAFVAHAVPGPMFSFAAYLCSLMPGDQGGYAGAALAPLAIFLPGLLLIAAALPLWQLIAKKPAPVKPLPASMPPSRGY
ncbi:chromate transporter [Sinobacterium norvegicum]|uniref:chromate transporter n=1 Tax=Sinobacterium norvegicum TaxID=1641715 RepID=UPI001F02D918|nr:chromate transporter [Sinobacterium norvegicum]